MKLSYKLILGYLLVASIAGSATYFALHSYRNIDDAFEQLMNDPVPTIKVLNELRSAGNRIVTQTDEIELTYVESKIVVTPNENSLLKAAEQQFSDSHKQFEESLKNYRDLIATQGESEKHSLPVIEQAGGRLIETSEQIIALKKQGLDGEQMLRLKTEFASRHKAYFQALNDALTHEYEQLGEERETVKATINESTITTLGVTFLTLTLAIILGLYISRSIAGRITKLKIASEKVGQGYLDTIIEIEGADEIGALTGSFNKMVNDLSKSRTELIASENFVNNIVSSIADSIIVLDMDLNVIRLNRATLDLSGYSEQELLNRSIKILGGSDFLNDRDLEELHAKSSVSGIEKLWRAKDSRQFSVLFSASLMRDATGAANGIVCVAQDITVRKSLEDQLSHQALHDSLTGLANRVLFRNRVEHALARVTRNREPIAVMFLDLDNFKTVNDTLGHEAGDTLLKSVAERLTDCLRQSDTIARLGGDEFAVLVENITHIEEVTLIAERLNVVLHESFLIAGKKVLVNMSIGIAFSGVYNENIEDLLRNADVAMYRAKNQGKACYVIFEDQMREDLIERVEFEAALRRAIEQKEFVLHYQPIINLQSEQIIGMEALVRWNHPERGLISPDKFIPVAEETNLIVPLGQWVLEEACRQTRRWQNESPDREHLSISVNLSNNQVQEANLVRQVVSALAESGLPPSSLILEITESTMLHETEATITKLQALKELGVRLAIDDFGTGYSSLSYLQRFPIDVLKIDKTFVDKINQGKEGAAVARAIITMSETLHLKTIAEGIETDGQNLTLQKMGCEFGQGYHFAKPLTETGMNEFLSKSEIGKDVLSPNQSLAE